jgi:cobalt-zinc-cadmium efflux system protein
MGHDHSPRHSHAAGRAGDRRRLHGVLAVTGTVLVVELVGAWVAGSLALLADAGHMATDAAGIVLALGASYLATRPATPRSTFGWHRVEILAALVNSLLLLGVCAYLAIAGVRRLRDPSAVDPEALVLFALVGLAANAVSAVILARADDQSLNMRGARLEVLSDLVGSVLAVLAGVVIWTTGWDRADAVASLVIAGLIIPRAWSLLRDSTAILLERTPPGVDLDDVRRHLEELDGVVDVHDLHAWVITSGLPSLSAHVGVTDLVLAERGVGPILDDLSQCVAEHFDIQHATFQVEPARHREHEDLGETDCR